MTSEESHKALHTKILDVFRLKSLKKNVKDPRETLLFKIKPEKSVSELIIPYRDLRDNFPYALIEYYEMKIKIKNEKAKEFEQLLTDCEKNQGKKQSIVTTDKREHKPSVKNKEKDEKSKNKEQENQEIDNIEEEENPNNLLILDYDYYLQENDMSVTKIIPAVFSEQEPNENRYLKDLNNDGNNMYGRKNTSNSSNYESKRKKTKN